MNNREFKLRLYNKLSELDVFYPKGTEVAIRCPFCGDSQKNERSAHFYIRINLMDDEPVLFNCFRADCGMSGILTPSILRTLKINDLQLNSNLISYNKKAMKSVNKQFGIKDNNFDLEVPDVDVNNKLNILKRDYINNRLGTDFSFGELTKMKVIFNFPQFLRHNGIEKLTVSKEKALLLHENYVGFLTTRNEFINFRNIFDNKLRRYEKYSIYQNIDNTRKFYTIPNEIDLLSNKTIYLNVAEGIFDILGIYSHIFNGEKENMIYAAVNGAAFTNVIKYFIQMGVVGNVVVNIFSDSNVSPRIYRKMIDELKVWVSEFNVFYNEIFVNGKADYGVPANKIKIKRVRI